MLGFKERRTVNVLAEECVYIATKKIKVFMIDRPLEGEPVVSSIFFFHQKEGRKLNAC